MEQAKFIALVLLAGAVILAVDFLFLKLGIWFFRCIF